MTSSTLFAGLASMLLVGACAEGSSSTRPDATADPRPAVRPPASESTRQVDVRELLWLLSPTGGPCPPMTAITVPPAELVLFLDVVGLLPAPDACEASP
jgi:hypothetical protein